MTNCISSRYVGSTDARPDPCDETVCRNEGRVRYGARLHRKKCRLDPSKGSTGDLETWRNISRNSTACPPNIDELPLGTTPARFKRRHMSIE